MTNKEIAKDISVVKNSIVNETYIAAALMTTPAVIAVLLFFSENELFSLPFQMTLVAYLFLVLGIAIFRNRIAYNIKIWTIIIVSYTIGLYSGLVLGFIGIGALYFLFSSLMITIHLKKKYAVFMFYFSLVIFMVIGVLRKNALLSFIIYKYDYFDSHRFWIYAIFSYAFLLSMIIRSIFALNTNLSDTIKMLICKNKEVEQLAYYDQLTNLPNRYKFKNILNEMMDEYSKNDKVFGLIILDIDNLKLINKHSNQLIGDRIIVGLANSLKNELKEAMVISRIDGDGFAMITSVPIKDNGHYLFDKIQCACNQTITNFPGINCLTCSVGMIDFSKETAYYEDLINNAEAALLFSKESGKNTYTIYNEVFGLEIQQKEDMIRELQLTVDTDGFELAFQPIYDALTKKIYEFEVLGRWHSDLYGFVSPDIFIPLLESSGLIIPYGYNMMRKALIQLKKWHEAGFNDLRIAVNISGIQFSDQNFYDYTISLLKQYEIKPEYLELEITESVFIYDYSYIKKTLTKLNDYGINLALDDFGTGYSSLSYLKDLPLHTLKIDKSFVGGINHPKSQEVLVSSLIKLAHDLDLVVIAEGVESTDQLNFLANNACDYLQGFYLCKPLKLEEIDLRVLKSYDRTS